VCGVSFYHLENYLTELLNSEQDEDSRSEGQLGFLLAPCSAILTMCSTEAPARHSGHCRATGAVGSGPTGDRVQLLAAVAGSPLSSFLMSPFPSCTTLVEGFYRWMDCHLKGGGRPQIPMFLKERRINEALSFVSGLKLISVPALAGTAHRREKDRRLQSFGHAALCVTCQGLFVIICAQWCRSHAVLLPGI
jgi:hypothetical protein